MKTLLNLLAAVAMLVWGTHLVRTAVLSIFGSNLRRYLQSSLGNRFSAALAGLCTTAVVQSSTATCLMTSSFVGQGLISLPAALAVMRGADVGTAFVSVLVSADLSWLSPLLLFVGVVLAIGRPETSRGRFGGVLIGLGVMLLALKMVVEATEPIFESSVMLTIISSVQGDLLLEIAIGATLAVVAYSSLAVVLLVAAMASSSLVPLEVALGFVLGANLGSGLLAVLTTSHSSLAIRQVSIGNLLFKLLGVAAAAPFVGMWLQYVRPHLGDPTQVVVLFHLAFNVLASIVFIWLTEGVSTLTTRLLPAGHPSASEWRPVHLDPSALSSPSPSQAIANAAREAMHQADIVENMLVGLMTVIRTNDLRLSENLKRLDHTVDRLSFDIKSYLTKVSRSALDEAEQGRWSSIISFTVNMEQIADIVQGLISDIEERKIKPQRSFSDAGLREISELHRRLVANLRLGMSVFLNSNPLDARSLIEEKARFRELGNSYVNTHFGRLADRTAQSVETSSLHLNLIGALTRINSHISSTAYAHHAS